MTINDGSTRTVASDAAIQTMDSDESGGGDELPRGASVGRFVVRRLLGRGGMGRVYLARDTLLGRSVALKLLNCKPTVEGLEALRREARLTARCEHRNIVTVYDVALHEDRPYLALEYVEGESLRDRLQSGPIPVADALRFARDIAHALQSAHGQALIHCDLKPSNLVIGRDGTIRLLDFGLSRFGSALGRAGAGTPSYMAPEQWTHQRLTPAVDVWALGVVLFEMVTARRPFADASPGRAYVPPRAGSEAVDEVVRRCLRVEPSERPDAGELLDLLARASRSTMLDDEPLAPYRGLEAFDERHERIFFGRSLDTNAFFERLRHQSVVAVVGASGIGKSSFVRAAVVPRLLARGPCRVISLRPGNRPFTALAAELLRTGEAVRRIEADEIAELANELSARQGLLNLKLHELVEHCGCYVLLFVDQLEELFTGAAERDQQRRFLASLAQAADDPSYNVRVVTTLRGDFVGAAADEPTFRAVLERPFMLSSFTRARLEEAIIRPLEEFGCAFDDPDLVTDILDAVGTEPDAARLPLLQFACRTLWERHGPGERLLRRAVFDDLGGVFGSLQLHADQVIDHLPAMDRRLARTLLTRLVTPARTRRAIHRGRLVAGRSDAERVLTLLVNARLVTERLMDDADETMVELVHEALIDHWGRLRRWLEEDAERSTLVQEMEIAHRQWKDAGVFSISQSREAWRRVTALDLTLPADLQAYLDEGARRVRRRIGWAIALFTLLLVTAAAGLLAARWYAARATAEETRRLEVERRLALSDLGRFQLELTAYDWDGDAQRPVPAEVAPDDWTLHQDFEGPPLQTQRSASGRRAWMVDAPRGHAYLRVARADCAPSWLRLDLPGYRDRTSPSRIALDIPTCQASAFDSIEIPAGPFINGGAGEPPRPAWDGRPEREVHLPGFRIARTEVSNARFAPFAALSRWTGYPRPEYPSSDPHLPDVGRPEHPVTAVDHATATAYCRYHGQRLPTSQQWEKTARGPADGVSPRRSFPWGEAPDPARANLKGDHDAYRFSAPVDSFPTGASPYGVLGLAGNVNEWTSSLRSGPGSLVIVRGGDWSSPPALWLHSTSYENVRSARYFDFGLGFRCVSDSH